MRMAQQIGWDTFDQPILDRAHRCSWCQTGAVAKAEDMRVHCHRWLTEGDVQHDVGRLATDAGQCFQCRTIRGDLAAVLVKQQL